MIIGVCGTFAAGKDVVADYIASQGYTHVSSGDVVREYIKANHLGGLDRDNLREVANRTRAEHGGDFFVRQALLSAQRPLVISGLRSSIEVEAIKREGGVLIGVDAPVSRRYQWAKSRGRIDDSITQEKFKQQELAEESDKPTDCQITTVMNMADYLLANDGSLSELYSKIDEVLKRVTTKP